MSLCDKEPIQLSQQVVDDISIEISGLLGKLILWYLQFGLLACLLWPLTVYNVPISRVEKLERKIGSYIRKWLGANQFNRGV